MAGFVPSAAMAALQMGVSMAQQKACSLGPFRVEGWDWGIHILSREGRNLPNLQTNQNL